MYMSQMNTLGERTLSKVKWRLVPFTCLLMFITYIDRANLSYAALTMNKELAISNVMFGALTSCFFISYFIFEVPSSMFLRRYGARKWIARILITWGIVTFLTMFVQTYFQIASARFLLGVMEAGFLPGIMFYFTLWLPQRDRGKAYSLFYIGQPAGVLIGAPCSGWILDHVHILGLSSWRWLFTIEGVLSVIIGIFTLFLLTGQPSEAKWLSEAEKNWLIEEIKKEDVKKKEARHVKLKEIFSSLKTWRLGLIYAFMSMSAAGLAFFLPLIVKDFSKVSNTSVGLLLMIPPAFALVAMVLWGLHSDKTMERKYHAAAAVACGLVGLLMAAMVPNVVLKMAGITLGMMAVFSVIGPFTAIPSLYLAGSGAAVGMAIVSTCNAFGQFISTFISGYLMSISSDAALAYYGLCYVVALILLLTLGIKKGDVAASDDLITDEASG